MLEKPPFPSHEAPTAALEPALSQQLEALRAQLPDNPILDEIAEQLPRIAATYPGHVNKNVHARLDAPVGSEDWNLLEEVEFDASGALSGDVTESLRRSKVPRPGTYDSEGVRPEMQGKTYDERVALFTGYVALAAQKVVKGMNEKKIADAKTAVQVKLAPKQPDEKLDLEVAKLSGRVLTATITKEIAEIQELIQRKVPRGLARLGLGKTVEGVETFRSEADKRAVIGLRVERLKQTVDSFDATSRIPAAVKDYIKTAGYREKSAAEKDRIVAAARKQLMVDLDPAALTQEALDYMLERVVPHYLKICFGNVSAPEAEPIAPSSEPFDVEMQNRVYAEVKALEGQGIPESKIKRLLLSKYHPERSGGDAQAYKFVTGLLARKQDALPDYTHGT